ncbi:hypothetical protein [Thiocapsa marina]|uniref:hypothetical protein n=1 Tax=Thiocapsa marina TaxID=244573 RepID=UPI000315D769|nr:hypothetical protein [Thiocapsa marina]
MPVLFANMGAQRKRRSIKPENRFKGVNPWSRFNVPILSAANDLFFVLPSDSGAREWARILQSGL